MVLEDKQKLHEAHAAAASKDGPRAASTKEDLLADLEFDLIDDPEAEEGTGRDVFARDTAIPDSPPEELALKSLGRSEPSANGNGDQDADGRGRAKPPPVRRKRLTPVTLEPPSADLEFDAFDSPIDVFSNPPRGGSPSAPPIFAPSDFPTAPPRAPVEKQTTDSETESNESGERAPPGAPEAKAGRRANRAAFLAETTRNQPIDFSFDGPPAAPPSAAAGASPGKRPSGEDPSPALSFVEGQRPLLDSMPPLTGLEPPPPPSNKPAGTGAQELQQAYAVGDYTRALEIAEQMLARTPDDLSTRRYAQNCRDVLTQMFAARIGPLDQVVTVIVSPEEVQWLSLDHRSGFLLSLVDGQSTVDEILDISGMTRLDALRIIHDLTKQQVVRLA